jgi:hypothetical protein
MVGFFLFSGGIMAAICAWFLYHIPVSDGYDFLALLVVAFGAFNLGLNIPDRSIRRKIGSAILFLFCFGAAFMSFAISPYLLGGAFLILAIGEVISWWSERERMYRSYYHAFMIGLSIIFVLFILLYYA